MIEISEFKPEEINETIEAMDSLREIIVPFLKTANYEGMAEQDTQQFIRHITLAKHALVAMGNYLEGKIVEFENKPLSLNEIEQLRGTPLFVVEDGIGDWAKFKTKSSMGNYHYFEFLHFGEEYPESFRIDFHGTEWNAYRYELEVLL